MNRQDCLEAAGQCILHDRQNTHGPAEDSFSVIAGMWSAYLGRTLAPHDVAAMMVLFKIARIKHNPGHKDSWVDAAGYAAIGGEVSP